MAIAGGVNLMLRPESSIMLSKAGFLNPDQYCKAFDESANGYVRGEGVGVVILKPLSKALADGDAIYACVRGTAVNQDGYLPEGFTVPNVFSQITLLETVYAQAGIDPSTVDYVEAHGPGTPVGDPIETTALGSVLGCERTRRAAELDHRFGEDELGAFGRCLGNCRLHQGRADGASRRRPTELTFQRTESRDSLGTLSLGGAHETDTAGTRRPSVDSGREFVRCGRCQRPCRVARARPPRLEWRTAKSNGQQASSSNGQAPVGATLYMLSAANRDSLASSGAEACRLLE